MLLVSLMQMTLPNEVTELTYLQENYRSQSFDHTNNKATPTLANNRGHSASISRYMSSRWYTTIAGKIRSLARWVRELHDRLQLIRVEAVAFACISLLLLARETFRNFSMPKLADVNLAVLVTLTGILMTFWINHPAT